MLFAKKSKGFGVEIGEHAVLIARLSQPEAPFVVEELKEFPASEPESLVAWLKGAEGKGATGYAHSTCAVYPAKRIVRRHTLDLKRTKDPAYFPEIYSQQFRIEPDKYTMRALNPTDGTEYDQGKGNQKEALFCGLPAEDVIALQDKMLEQGIYPERLELGTLATLGGMVSYLKFKQSKTPVLVLEIGQETTHSFILSSDGVDISRPIPSGISAMIPVVQKELGLKDEESAKKLFYSNTFDFTSMGGGAREKAPEGAAILDRFLRSPDRPIHRQRVLHPAADQPFLAERHDGVVVGRFAAQARVGALVGIGEHQAGGRRGPRAAGGTLVRPLLTSGFSSRCCP